MESVDRILQVAVGYAWGWPLVILLVGGGLYLMVLSRGVAITGLGRALGELRSRDADHDPDHPDAAGQLSSARALATALSAVVGVGNIAGVAVAISQGGPGAVFWMWLAAVVGMATKFFTAALSVMYRKKDELGVWQGGPMYYIEVGLGRRYRGLAILFSVCGLIGCLALFQANQLSEILAASHGVEPAVTGLVCAVLVAVVVVGGIRRIGSVTVRLVPLMCLVYLVACACVLISRWELVPGVFAAIVDHAFHGSAAVGGATGIAVSRVITVGVKRAAFSNEAGIGTSAMAYGASRAAEPIRQGLIAMLDPFIDTVVVCTMTALVILTTDYWQQDGIQGVALTARAFEAGIGQTGRYLITLSVSLFAISTMIGYSYYGRKCLCYLLGARRGRYYDYFYIVTIIGGALWSVGAVIDLIDTAFALMAVPNMIATLILAPRVMERARRYFARPPAVLVTDATEPPRQ